MSVPGPMGELRDWVSRGKKRHKVGGCVEEVLTGSERILRVNRSCFSPPPPEGFAAPEALRFAGAMLWECPAGDGCLVPACTF